MPSAISHRRKKLASDPSPYIETAEGTELSAAFHKSKAYRELRTAYDSGEYTYIVTDPVTGKAVIRAGTKDTPVTKTVQVTTDQKEHIRYLIDDDELFARGYAQYIGRHAKATTTYKRAYSKMHDELRVAHKAAGNVSSRYRQWDDDDFAPIAEEFEKVFNTLHRVEATSGNTVLMPYAP